jgi:HSP90 family molecular chaperone
MAESIGFKPTSVNVHGLTALIRNLGRDCTPDQFMREFVQNSIEACQRTGLSGRRVLIDYNHGIQVHSGIFKLSFTDNGDGMSLEQMNNLLNSISSSGGAGNTFENYGVTHTQPLWCAV